LKSDLNNAAPSLEFENPVQSKSKIIEQTRFHGKAVFKKYLASSPFMSYSCLFSLFYLCLTEISGGYGVRACGTRNILHRQM
jgi:hypothetical protein